MIRNPPERLTGVPKGSCRGLQAAEPAMTTIRTALMGGVHLSSAFDFFSDAWHNPRKEGFLNTFYVSGILMNEKLASPALGKRVRRLSGGPLSGEVMVRLTSPPA